MNPFELKKILEEKFEVLEFTDLNAVTQRPSLGFKIFKDQYKQNFDAQERIVFYANGHVGTRALKFLQYAADTFDVSRCFVLVCCPSHDTVSTSSDIEFFTTKIHADNFEDQSLISVDSLCVMPNMSVEFFNDGTIKTCCYIKDTLNDPNNFHSTKELFYSEKMTRLRKSLLSGEKPKSCETCWSSESSNFESLRKWRNKAHRDEFFTDLIDNPRIQSIGLRVNTTCNFKCRICGPDRSSLWAEEMLNHTTDKKILQHFKNSIQQNKWFDNNQTLTDDIKTLCKDLDFIDIYGGETLLIKQFKSMIEHCVKIGSAQRQTLHFQTNGSLFPEETFKLLDQFREIHIGLSIDNIGKRFELERGGNWDQIEKNIDKFLALDPNKYKITILTTVSNLNLLYLDELVEWANKKQLTFTMQMLEQPHVYLYTQVSQAVIDMAIKKYHNHANEFLRSIAEKLQNTSGVDTAHWISVTRTLDQRRGQCLKQSHPELAQAMGYI
jgi:sulfatase maturation enzyme AslB (radical SAM superfamily)